MNHRTELIPTRRRRMRSGRVCGFEDTSCLATQGHFLGHPEPDTPTDQTKPHHQIVFFGAVEAGHGLPQEARVDKETRHPRNGVML